MLEQEKFWYKKCFANKILYSVKLEAQELLMIKKCSDFTFSIV